MDRYAFVDNYYAKEPELHTVVYVVNADSEDQAWQKFSRYAIPQFGLKRGSTVAEVKAHFEGFLTVYGPNNVMELSNRYDE